jgi:hypothetical protein
MCEGALPLPRSALGALVDAKYITRYHEGIFIADLDSMDNYVGQSWHNKFAGS